MHVTFVVAAALYMLAANEDMKQSCNDLKNLHCSGVNQRLWVVHVIFGTCSSSGHML